MHGNDPRLEVKRRVLEQYLPAWCAVKSTRDPAAFKPDWEFLTPEVALQFLAAVDEQIVSVRDGSFWLPDSSRTHIFGDNKPKLYREGFLEVAAAGLLAAYYGWPLDQIRFQSPWPWAYDLFVYDGSRESHHVAIAVEVKWRQDDALALVRALESCRAHGHHSIDACKQLLNHHRKYEGLVEHRPRVLWIIGPKAFSGAPDLVFRVTEEPDGLVRLDPAEATALNCSRP